MSIRRSKEAPYLNQPNTAQQVSQGCQRLMSKRILLLARMSPYTVFVPATKTISYGSNVNDSVELSRVQLLKDRASPGSLVR
jgi:hypothetical protein